VHLITTVFRLARRCPRRILIYCEIQGLLSRSTMSDARFAHSPRPSHHDGFSTCAARRATRSCRRIRSDQTSDVDSEPFGSPCAQYAHSGSVNRGMVFPLDQTESAP